ncbi:VOC family protein [uncultured Pseudomonas sp.]|uniref:VOC family protein n=1 Tax=uncultured Pseudomonas sp. TaxID=114707 RepID=UPI0025FAC184|nr:VOC family protein [uncultured Pseudomonas sp.]
MSVLDHLELAVTDIERARHFYLAALAPLGLGQVIAVPASATRSGPPRYGFGRDGYPRFWIQGGGGPAGYRHLAFAADNRAAVSAFHAAALAAGGTDQGAPGLRLHYHARYFAAYVLDPDGISVEAVYQGD